MVSLPTTSDSTSGHKAANDIALHFEGLVSKMTAEKQVAQQLGTMASLKEVMHTGDNTQVAARPVGDMSKGPEGHTPS